MAVPVELPALRAPIAVFPNYIAQRSETIKMQERLFALSRTDDAFHVQTVDGRDILKVTADIMSLHNKKRVLDVNGNHLFTVCHQVLSIPRSYYIESPNGQRIFEVKGKFHLGTSHAVINLTNALDGQRVNLFMRGALFNKQIVIRNEATSEIVAQVDRNFFNARQMLGGRHTYAVTVAPGMDIAAAVAMVVCEDERREENSGQHSVV